MGQKFVIKNKRKSKNGKFNIVDIEVYPSSLKALPDKNLRQTFSWFEY